MTQEEINKAFEGRWHMKRYILENIDGKAAKEIARDFFEAGILLAEGGESKNEEEAKLTKEQLLKIRAANFCNRLTTPKYIGKYGQQMISDFIDYWTEANPSHTKLRFEMQKVFDLDRRLARWARNNFNRYDRQQTPSENLDKLTDILVG